MMPAAVKNDEAMWGAFALSVAAACVIPAAIYREAIALALVQRLEPITSFASRGTAAAKKPAMTVQEMVAVLRDGAMPISAIAEAMRVERKTVYSWLNGNEVRGANAQRAALVHSLMTGVPDVDVRNVYRFWNTPVDGERTLRDVLTAEVIDEHAARSAMEGLRPAAQRAIGSERRMSRQGPGNPILDELPEVVVNR
jgi:hypothetical protein